MSRKLIKNTPVKVVLEKTGTHVEVTAGPYTKRELRELLQSSLSLLPETGERETELIKLSGVDPDDLRSLKEDETLGVDGEELFIEESKESAVLELVQLIANDLENNLVDLLRSKGISDDLINRILTYGLTDETIRLLKQLGLTDEEIARLFGMWQTLNEQRSSSEASCRSTASHSEEDITIESFYLKRNFRNPLTKALADVVSKKPYNPAEYLGQWLLNYKICEERARMRKEFNTELQVERERR